MENANDMKMPIKKEVGAKVDEKVAKEFHTRCIEYNTTMSAVITAAMTEFMKTHPQMKRKNEGIV